MSNNEEITFKERYKSVLQGQIALANTQNIVVEGSRGVGKTTEIMAERLVNMAYDMPGGIILLVEPTFVFIMDTILPGIIKYLATHYQRGLFYEYGTEPPKFFKRPLEAVTDWKRTLSFPWGTVIKFGSLDRPESIIGKSNVAVVVDEVLRVAEDEFIERVIPTLRDDKSIFGKSHYFRGISLYGSTPNFENDHDWFLNYEKNVKQSLVEEIMEVQRRVFINEFKLQTAYQQLFEAKRTYDINIISRLESDIAKMQSFKQRWEEKLREKRKSPDGSWSYFKASSFSNLAALGFEYIEMQLAGSRFNFDKFKLSILGIRPEKVKEMFFARFTKKHIYKDSYIYANGYDQTTVAGEYKRTSDSLRYCEENKPILLGFDPGNFMSCVVAQEKQNILRVLKNFYVWTPKQHYELALEINQFFINHKHKLIKLYYDRAGNKRLDTYANNPKGKTDATILKRELEDLGWRVELMNINQRTIEHWEHFLLLDVLLSERDKNKPKLRFCQFECEELISSIFMSPIKRDKDAGIQLDKTSEVKLDYEDQPWYSTQLPSALMYLIFGLYEKFKPTHEKETAYIPGL